MTFLLLAILQLASLLLIARAVLSWFQPRPDSPVFAVRRVVDQLTDPVVLPVRRVLPHPGGLDLSVFALLLAINLLLVPIVSGL